MTSSTHNRLTVPPARDPHADGTKLLLRADGTIVAFDADGKVTTTWHEHDEGWDRQAIRFGLRPRPETIKPGPPDPIPQPTMN